MKSLIFVVDREREVREFARKCLETAGYNVQTFARVLAISEVPEQAPVLVVAGVDEDGLRNWELPSQVLSAGTSGRIPCIALLNSSSVEHRRAVLDAGADDCVVKPFTPRDLLIVVEGWMRRSVLSEASGSSKADIIIDSWAMKLLVRGIEIPTTALEFRLVEYLARHRGQVFTRDFLLDAVWGDMRFINPRSVDACIRRVREKIEPDRAKPTMLKTIRGVGYRLDAITEWQSAPNAGCNCPACKSRENGITWQTGSKHRRPSA